MPVQNQNKALQEQTGTTPQGVPLGQTQNNPAPQVTSPVTATPIAAATAPVSTGTPQQTGANAQQAAATGTLTMPASGSIVDLLNMAGQDPSFANRQQLAQTYGVQNYTGTAAQNQDLAQKYLDAFNKVKTTAVPQTPADGRLAVQNALTQTPSLSQNPAQQFMDVYGSMNPVEANLFQQLSTLTSSIGNQQSLSDFYQQEVAKQGIPALNTQLANVNRIMEGTEDDIRDEITNTGGFATESQVQALTAARNKTLLKQANYLTNLLNAKNDYVDHIVSLTQADRAQVSKDLDQKLGITNTLISMAQRMDDNARQNYQSIVDSVGWGGLAAAVADSPEQAAKVEKMFGLGEGELKTLASYKKPLTPMEQLQMENQKLQNLKLRQDLAEGPSVSTQVVDVGGRKVLINSKTGQTIAEITPGTTEQGGLQLAQQQQTIQDSDSLLDSPGLNSAVGTSFLTRGSFGPLSIADTLSGTRSNFIAGVEQLTRQLTIDQLISAKSSGATFGALSDDELKLVAGAASKINSWAIKDKAGNVTGYNVDEKSFKQELGKINNFQKMDFILKGGDPASVGVQEMQDGTFWVKNSDGSYTKLQ